MSESPLNAALRQFEAVEANLVKAEKLLAEIEDAIPSGIAFGDNPDYETNCRNFDALINALPKIDGWKPQITLMKLDEIVQNRSDAQEVGVSVKRQVGQPSRFLREYRNRFNQKRRELIRDPLIELVDAIDANLHNLSYLLEGKGPSNEVVTDNEFEQFKENVAQIATLLGSIVAKPAAWSNLNRHMYFGMLCDLHDIIKHDWPSVKAGLRKSIYGEKVPIPVEIEDIGALVSAKPRGPVTTRLKWESLTDEEFERLIFLLISSVKSGYENPKWLMRINAPDRGRDLSVYRVYADPLCGTLRQRVIIQCKHWQSRSVAMADIAVLKDQMKLWEPPIVDNHIIATSGRFTSDAVKFVEKHNQSDSALRIDLWSESHLERLLDSWPSIIAEFRLR